VLRAELFLVAVFSIVFKTVGFVKLSPLSGAVIYPHGPDKRESPVIEGRNYAGRQMRGFE